MNSCLHTTTRITTPQRACGSTQSMRGQPPDRNARLTFHTSTSSRVSSEVAPGSTPIAASMNGEAELVGTIPKSRLICQARIDIELWAWLRDSNMRWNVWMPSMSTSQLFPEVGCSKSPKGAAIYYVFIRQHRRRVAVPQGLSKDKPGSSRQHYSCSRGALQRAAISNRITESDG